MVRSHSNRSVHTSVPEGNDLKEQKRARRNRSPAGDRPAGYVGSPKRNSSSWHPSSSERKGGDDSTHLRSRHRRDSARDVGHRPNDSSTLGAHRHSSSLANSNGRNHSIKRLKWRRNRNKKKRRKRRPPLSGANCAPVSGNRQPIASMRMRMDDYVTPRSGRLLPLGKSNDIEHAVARARREASTRTKDTFWTKKLLDAESSHPNRWAHSGFKELYREELGYSELEYKENEKNSSRRSPVRGTLRIRSPVSGKPRSPSDRYSNSRKIQKGKADPRLRGGKSPTRKFSKSRSKSRSRSPRGRKRSRLNSPLAGGARKSYLKPNKRSFSRSLSRSPSSISSDSRSDSRSYSSYSRSSSQSSSSSSSSYSSSTSGSISFRRGRRRSYSRSSKSWSRSPSPARPPARHPPKIKTASLSRAVQSVHAGKKAKPLTKTVSNEPSKSYYPSPAPAVVSGPSGKPKVKKARPISLQEPPPHHRRHDSSISSPPVSTHRPPEDDFYDKNLPGEKVSSSAFPEHINKIPFGNDPRRSNVGEKAGSFKAPLPSGALALHHHEGDGVPAPRPPPRSEGEQTNSESSTDEDELPLRMTLSERFGKLAQLSSQRQEYEGVRMKIVREGGQDKKVYLEGVSRSPSPVGRRVGGSSNIAHERWLREHKAEYDEYEERYGEFRHWDPHRDLPRELPPNWDDVNVRYSYYKESGYFGDRSITMEDYLKWEEWWYLYRNWLEKYGGVQDDNLKYRTTYTYDVLPRSSTRERWMRRESHRDKEGGRKRHRY